MDRLTAKYLIAALEQILSTDAKNAALFKLYDSKLSLLAEAAGISPLYSDLLDDLRSRTSDALARLESRHEGLELRLERMKSDLEVFLRHLEDSADGEDVGDFGEESS